MSSQTPLRVGIIGLGEVAQVIHIPNLLLLDHLYTIVAVCDVSKQAVQHCQKKFHVSKGTTNVEGILKDEQVDLVLNLTSHEQHEWITIAALRAGKHVMLEKPMTLSLPSAQRILEAAQAAKGKVFMGYMRRYASSFTTAFKREVASIDQILYARSRDIIGPNSHFVGQSGTFPIKFTDIPPEAGEKRKQLQGQLLKECFGDVTVTQKEIDYCLFLGGLGSHDLSLMRETLGGLPESVTGVSANEPFYSAIFNYRNKNGSPFAVTYESGIDLVPRFDAHLAVYGKNKSVSIHYDTPYVKGKQCFWNWLSSLTLCRRSSNQSTS